MEIALWYKKVATKNDETSKWSIRIYVNTISILHIFSFLPPYPCMVSGLSLRQILLECMSHCIAMLIKKNITNEGT